MNNNKKSAWLVFEIIDYPKELNVTKTFECFCETRKDARDYVRWQRAILPYCNYKIERWDKCYE